MNSEPTNFAELVARRKTSAQETLREVSSEELRALIAKLFPDGTHPWSQSFTNFIDEHQSERALQSETSDGISFVYYPTTNRGVCINTKTAFAGSASRRKKSPGAFGDSGTGK
jgi:hypothetical protein